MELQDLYLSDGVSQIDYLLVYSNSTISKVRYYKRIFNKLLNQLDALNIIYEPSQSSEDDDIRCLKIHVPSGVLEEYANIYKIELAYKNPTPKMGDYQNCPRFLHTILTHSDPTVEIFKRISRRKTGTDMELALNQAERILLTYIILSNVKFGNSFEGRGVETIQKMGAIKAMFPLHEGGTEWTTSGSPTQRQLLNRYWVDVRNIMKIQPLNAIERYFGPEMAFLYAYLQHTTEMLFIATILGLTFYFIGVSVESHDAKEIRHYICTSDKLLCPTCDPRFCKPKPLKTFCGLLFRLNQTFDNIEMFLLGICITLWGTMFTVIWKRRQTLCRFRWNLTSFISDLQIRTGYEERTDLLVLNPFTNELELTMPMADVAARVFISATFVVVLIALVFCIEIVVIMMKVQLKIVIDKQDSAEIFHKNVDSIVSLIGSSVTVVFILLIDLIYQSLSKILTDWENPRTQKQYDNSYMMKCFLFAFANNYTMVLYIAFFKGKFYSYPGDVTMNELKGAYIFDTCHLGECNSDLALQVMVILGVKHLFFKCVGRYLYGLSFFIWENYKRKKKSSVLLEQWEKDYILKSFGRYDIMKKYIEIILRHGMVLFFTSVCPFTPLLTLIVNILEMKLYSRAYLQFYRRPIPRKVEGIEMFFFILQALTWFGVTANAILALMTKSFGKMHFYMASVNNDIKIYMDKTYSEFSMEDYKGINISHIIQGSNVTVCYYPGNRYPPSHPRKYEVHDDFYRYKMFSWMTVVIYLHVVFILTRLIAQIIPDRSTELTDYLSSLHEENKRELRLFRNQQYMSQRSIHLRTSDDFFEVLEEVKSRSHDLNP